MTERSPRCKVMSGAFGAPGGIEHPRVDIHPDNLDAAPRKLYADPARAAPRVQYRFRAECLHEIRLAMHILPGALSLAIGRVISSPSTCRVFSHGLSGPGKSVKLLQSPPFPAISIIVEAVREPILSHKIGRC